MGSYTYQDTLYYLKQLGHTCKTLYYHFPNKFHDDFFCDRFEKQLQSDSYDAVMSINFFPLVATLCHAHQIPYLAWCYDSPLEEKLEEYFSYDTNRIFLFDRIEAEHYQSLGYSRVYHLPLAVNTDRLDRLQFSPAQMQKHRCDVSFIGQLYESPLQVLLYSADDYIKGYIEGILQAQLRVYGYYFIDELITDELLDSVNQSFRKIGQTSLTLNRRGLSFAIASEITNLERCFLLEQMGELFNTHFYTTKPHSLSDHVISLGPVKYMEEMPCVFRYSKLNPNPTLKSIQSGTVNCNIVIHQNSEIGIISISAIFFITLMLVFIIFSVISTTFYFSFKYSFKQIVLNVLHFLLSMQSYHISSCNSICSNLE